MNGKPFLSIIVCTLDNAQELGEALESLCQQTPTPDPGEAEIWVIDNGPSDTSRDTVRHCASRSPVPIHYEVLAELGVAHARNRGIELSSGDIVAFMDDDAQADPSWLASLLGAFRTWPHVDAVGGAVVGLGVESLPNWIPRRLHTHLSLVDYGPEAKVLRYPRYPFGTNMAIRRSAFEKVGLFDARFGRCGVDSMLTGEETDFFFRLERTGASILYQPSIKVSHRVRPERMTPEWLACQSFWIGRSSAMMERGTTPRWRLATKALTALPLIAAGYVTACGARLCGNQYGRVMGDSLSRNRLGYVKGLMSL